MAGNKNSGGYRPNAPQNNPANVSATGGAGQSGNYTGFGYGQNQELNQSRVAGNQAMQSIQANTPKPEGPYSGISMPQLGSLMDDSTNPSEPITAGLDFGPGPGSEVLPKQFQNNTRPQENMQVVKDYLPDLALAAQSPNAPDSFKRFVTYLAGL